MRRFLTIILILQIACSVYGQKKVILYPERFVSSNPLKVVGCNDSLILNLDIDHYVLSTKGKLTLNGNTLVQLQIDYFIINAFLLKEEKFLLIFIEETGHETSKCSLHKINLSENHVEWYAEIPGANLGPPIITDNTAYITSAGCVGKIDLSTGNYIWKHFYWLLDQKKYFFYSFDTILIRFDTIEFMSRDFNRNTIGKVIVDDKTGEILRIIN